MYFLKLVTSKYYKPILNEQPVSIKQAHASLKFSRSYLEKKITDLDSNTDFSFSKPVIFFQHKNGSFKGGKAIVKIYS